MEVQSIPIPAVATIKVTKEGKTAAFDTTVIQTTDNKYIYVMPVRKDKKLVNFDGSGLVKEIRVQFERDVIYAWRNISIIKFIEGKNLFLRITTRTPGVRATVVVEPPKKKKKMAQIAQAQE